LGGWRARTAHNCSNEGNRPAKSVIETLSAEELSAKTITEIISVLKYVVASVLDENGGEVYPRQWNHDFMDLPIIGKQNQPAFTPEQVEKIVGKAQARLCGALRSAGRNRDENWRSTRH